MKQWFKCYHCNKRIYVLYHRKNEAVSLFTSEVLHQEQDHEQNDFYVPDKTRQKVLELTESKHKAK